MRAITAFPLGVTLTPSGTITTDTSGAVVSGLDITGGAVITAPTVIEAPSTVIEKCEVFSIDPNGSNKGVLLDDAATGGVVRGRDIHDVDDHDVEDGVFISITGIVVGDNYILDLKSAGCDPHYDGIQLHGGATSDVTIHQNSVSEFPNINNRW